MSGQSDYTAKNVLKWMTGQVAMPALPAVYVALFTAVGADDGTGFTEVAGGAYARQQVAGSAVTNGTTAAGNAVLHFAATPAWVVQGMSVYDATGASLIPAGTTVLSVAGTTVTMSANAAGAGVGNGDTIVFSAFAAPTGTGPSQTQNGAAVTFPAATADWTAAGASPVIAVGFYDAAASGNLIDWDYLGNYAWLPATVSSASPGVLTAHAHGYAVPDALVVSTEFGGVAPTFSQSNFTGVLKVAHQATDTFDVTNGGTAVNTSATGDVMVRKIVQQLVPSGIQVSFPANALTLVQA